MTRKIFKAIFRVIIFILIYLLQIYVINNTTFFGVTGDLCLIGVVLITLIDNNYVAFITAGVCGIISDILFSPTVCKYLIIYIIMVSVLIGLKKMYKQDNKVAIIIFTVAGVIVSEILMFVFDIITKVEVVNIFSYIFMIFKECIINIFLAFLLYLILRLCKQEG